MYKTIFVSSPEVEALGYAEVQGGLWFVSGFAREGIGRTGSALALLQKGEQINHQRLD